VVIRGALALGFFWLKEKTVSTWDFCGDSKARGKGETL